MKPFESFLAPSLEEYLAYRRTLGYVDKNMRSCLRSFDRYVKEKASAPQPLPPLFFLAMRKELPGEHRQPRSCRQRRPRNRPGRPHEPNPFGVDDQNQPDVRAEHRAVVGPYVDRGAKRSPEADRPQSSRPLEPQNEKQHACGDK